MSRLRRRSWFVVSLVLIASGVKPAHGQDDAAVEQTDGSEITLKQIMADPDWIGNEPSRPYWADDGDTILYWWEAPGAEFEDLYEIDLEGRLVRMYGPEERHLAPHAGGEFSTDRSRKIWSDHGDLFLKDRSTGEIRQLTRTREGEYSPRFFAGSNERIMFERGGAWIARDLTTLDEWQLVDVRAEDDPDADNADTGDESYDYLKKQQERLFEFIRENEARRDASEARLKRERDADPTRGPEPFYLGTKRDIRQVSISPNGRWALVRLQDKGGSWGRNDTMPQYVTEDGYVESRSVRSKVGTGSSAAEALVLLDLDAHEWHELDLAVLPGIADDPLAELREKAKAEFERRLEHDATDETGADDDSTEVDADIEVEAETETEAEAEIEKPDADAQPEEERDDDDATDEDAGDDDDAQEDTASTPRAVSINRIEWSDDGSQVAVQMHSHDNKDRWLASVDFDEAALRPVHHLHDPAWIGWRYNEFGWRRDHETLWYLSEEDGYSHLYLIDATRDDAEPRRLTEGEFVVSNVTLDRDGDDLYYISNETHPGIEEVYRVHADSGAVEQLTTLGGQLSYRLSPDESRLLLSHSEILRPTELFVQPNAPGSDATRLTHTVRDEWASLPWVEPEIVAIPSSHQDDPIYSRVYTPDESNKLGVRDGRRPAVVFIHGAGYLQNAHYGWSSYFREFMFHTLLTRHGYAVLDMDYRASAGYGRDWRTAIYRRMGTPELEDLRDGVEWIVANRGVDRERVGVYGGSYGGFLTLMALFTEPDLFACGAALRSVTDWAHYNHGYTANILNTPEVDPWAYERSSPIEFAEGLEKPLLMCHGMQDDNVFAQDTVRLAQRLIELEKENWEMALYPIEPHAFRTPAGWLDEYRRIFKLFETHLK
ncbi:MAG: prolyl oligopeptidase family serine peptidase [Phycisphaerales bacterium]